ncbi:hypothetical protein OSB04_017430 [Centaurea solstitialis]|uniref:Cytochrome P450 n=1 Tax=Centaurea solstitialis TaxID=347529 RepID=A0AA38WIC5_9ASTR|nr:hypothetical protein OSB04_017430 [Centaurea solstitialis]
MELCVALEYYSRRLIRAINTSYHKVHNHNQHTTQHLTITKVLLMDITSFLKDNNLSVPFFVLSSIFFLLLVVKLAKPTSSKKLPPGPRGLPIIGNLHQVGDRPHASTAKFAKEYGPLISLRLGKQILVVASSPDAAREILKTQDRFLSSRVVPTAFQQPSLIPHSLIWSDCNQTWKGLRTLCRTELFSAKALESHSRLREQKLGHLVDFLHKNQGQVINLEDVVFITLFNTLTSIIFSRDFLDLKDVHGTRDGLNESLHKIIEYGGIIKDFGIRKGTMKQYNKTFAYWEDIIEERRAHVNSPTWSSENAESFLDRMLENGFSNDQINQLVTELFVAGTNTTTSSVVWAMTELVRHKEVIFKIAEEIKREINTDKISDSHLSKLPYLQASIKEAMRLHPPVPLLLPHMAAETCEVMNYTIPKNSKIFVNLWAMGRDPKVWDDPLSFKPERFIGSKIDIKGQDFELLPFGSGRRTCPRMPSGIKSVQLILASLINDFDLVLPNNVDPMKLDMSDKFGIALKMEKPLKELFVAGTNTTTSSVVWAMIELVRHKEILFKIAEEIKREINTDKISDSQLSKLPYLQASIKEAMRLHPPVPLLLPHMAAETCEVMNYTIPKNAKILVNLWEMGRDPKVWEDPLSFKPERFIGSKLDIKGQDFELLPFGTGRRMCPGMPLGIKSVQLILVSLINEFDLVLPNDVDPMKLDMSDKFGIALKMEKPLKVIFKSKD